MSEVIQSLSVECHAGYRGEETPRRFRDRGRVVELDQLLECWHEPDRRCFKMRGLNGSVYLLCQDCHTGIWQLESSEPGPENYPNTQAP